VLGLDHAADCDPVSDHLADPRDGRAGDAEGQIGQFVQDTRWSFGGLYKIFDRVPDLIRDLWLGF